MKLLQVGEKYPSSSKNHGASSHKESWESMPLDTWESPKKFTDDLPLFTTLPSAETHPLPVYFGMSEAAAKALVVRSQDMLDTDLQEFLPGDKNIFTDTEACAHWLAEKNRFPFVVFGEEDARRPSAAAPDLAAFFWFTEEKPDETITVNMKPEFVDRLSVRVYKDFRGKGITQALGVELLRWHAHVRGDKPVLLSVRADNASALQVYKKLFFEEAGSMPDQADGHARLYMRHNAERFQKEYSGVGW